MLQWMVDINYLQMTVSQAGRKKQSNMDALKTSSCEAHRSKPSSRVNMKSPFSILAFGVCLLFLVLSGCQCKAKHKLNHDVVDAFKIFRDFDYGVAIFDVDQSGELDCLTARRTAFDENGPSATYVWILTGLHGNEKKNLTLHARPGSTPDKPLFTVGDGETPEQTAHFIYTDYKSCSVIELPFQGTQECMLWATTDVKDNVPQYCVEQFEDNCDVEDIAYDKDTCSQFVS